MSTPPVQVPPALTESHHALRLTARRATVYLALVLLPTLLMLVAGFVIIPTQWFALHSQDPYLVNLGYGDTLHDADCKVLIYGDSAAMVGADPLTIGRLTGLPACNIAEYVGVTAVNGMMIPDRFLRDNPRPRYIVFLFGPEDYVRSISWNHLDVTEAIIYRLRTVGVARTALLMLRHPAEFLSWAERGMHHVATNLRQPTMAPGMLTLRSAARGRLAIKGGEMTACGTGPAEQAPDPKWIADLRRKYGVDGTRVLIDVMPVPDCDPSYGFYKDRFAGLADNTLEQYPRADYVDNGRLHLGRADGIERLSNSIAAQIDRLEREALMLFSSNVFLFVFLPIGLLGYQLLSRFGSRAVLSWLTLVSLFFYGFWAPAYLLLLGGSILLNYGAALLIVRAAGNPARQSLLLKIGVCANLLLLMYFKYLFPLLNFFHAHRLLSHEFSNVVLPLGISFFTFTQIAFLIDLKEGIAAVEGLLAYSLFVTFFPHLIAGPIIHPREMMPQFAPGRLRTGLKRDDLLLGLTWFILGLAKKVLIADRISPVADAVFAHPSGFGVGGTWIGVLAYSMQLYFDFSGYSDMAVGLARMFSIEFPVNFNSPYKSVSVVDLLDALAYDAEPLPE